MLPTTSHSPSVPKMRNSDVSETSPENTSGSAVMYSFKSRSPSARLTPSTPCTRDVPLTLTISPPRRSTASRSSAMSGLWSCVSALASPPSRITARQSPTLATHIRPPRRYAVVAVAPPRRCPSARNALSVAKNPRIIAALMCSTNPVSVAVSALSARRTSRKISSCRRAAPKSAASLPPCPSNTEKMPCVGSPSSPGAAVYASSHDCLRLPRLLLSANVSPSTTTVSSAAPASRKSFSVARRMETPAPCVSMSFEMLSAGGRFRFLKASAALDVGEFTATRPCPLAAHGTRTCGEALIRIPPAHVTDLDGGVRAEPSEASPKLSPATPGRRVELGGVTASSSTRSDLVLVIEDLVALSAR
mmetsp:Transcript_7706/g.32759  ORF Transcript_7706/g.32759 Transcript_7706/m.32759 type:complete len:361 (-) Transcript_7706:165-1247(-)